MSSVQSKSIYADAVKCVVRADERFAALSVTAQSDLDDYVSGRAQDWETRQFTLTYVGGVVIRSATLSSVNEALSAAHAALVDMAREERSEGRKGYAWTACTAIEKAQGNLIKDTRP